MAGIESMKGITSSALKSAYGAGDTAGVANDGGGFGNMLKGMVDDVSRLQEHSGDVQKSLLSGEAMDVEDVMIAGNEAGLAFDLMLEIRNKLVEAYQEIMRMQV